MRPSTFSNPTDTTCGTILMVSLPTHGHGKKTLASILVTLNLLAFALHTVAQLCVLAWRTALAARGARYRFFEHLRTITAYIVFHDWPHLLQSIADPKARPP